MIFPEDFLNCLWCYLNITILLFLAESFRFYTRSLIYPKYLRAVFVIPSEVIHTLAYTHYT